MSDNLPVAAGTDDLGLNDLSPTIAAELAAQLSSPDTIRKRYCLTTEQWKKLTKSPVFREMVKEQLRNFRGDMAAGKRITVKAEILLEDAMPELYHIAKDSKVPSAERVNAIKQLGELAGRGKQGNLPAGSGGGGFVLNINIGKDKGITINGTAEPSDGNENG